MGREVTDVCYKNRVVGTENGWNWLNSCPVADFVLSVFNFSALRYCVYYLYPGSS
jgi:hypothetical protein